MTRTRRVSVPIAWSAMLLTAMIILSCSRQPSPAPAPEVSSKISVTVNGDSPMVITTATAEFQILRSGYVRASLGKSASRSLDDPDQASTGSYLVQRGKQTQFLLDFSQAKIEGASGKLGRGVRIMIPARPSDASVPVRRLLQVEVYDDFPNLVLASASYTNGGSADYVVDQIVEQQHRFASHDSAHAWDLWSYQGSSYDWGEDDVVHLTKAFHRPNVMGAAVKGGLGGGIPVAAFWTASVGEAIGHLETLPLVLSLPVKVADDGRINSDLQVEPGVTLQPGDTYSTPRSFVSVYSGDYYEPLRLYSNALERE